MRASRLRGAPIERTLPHAEVLQLLPKTRDGKFHGQVATFRIEVDVTINIGYGDIVLETELMLHAVRYGKTGRGQFFFYSRAKEPRSKRWGDWIKVPGKATATGGQYEDAARYLAQLNRVQMMDADEQRRLLA